MARGWGSYFAKIDGRTASLLLDLDPPPAEIVETLGHLLHVRIALRSPGSHGLTIDREHDTLAIVEEELEALACAELRGRFVGRYTHDGRRTWLLYVPTHDPNTRSLEALLKRHGYAPDTWVEPDQDWKTYWEWLYPAPEELQTIEDRRTLDVLAEQGDRHEIPRDVDHWIYFPTPASRAGFLSEIGDEFGIRSTWDDAEGQRRFGLQIFRRQAVDFDSLAPVVRDLFQRALKHEGEYDGWETSVERAR